MCKRYQLFIPACRKDCSTSNNEFLDSIVCTRPRPWEHPLSTKHRPSAILFLLVGEITVQRFSYIGLWALNAKLSLLLLWLSASWRCRVKNLEACWGLWCGHPSASRCHFSPTFEGERFRKNLSFTPFSDCLQLNIFQGEWLLSEKNHFCRFLWQSWSCPTVTYMQGIWLVGALWHHHHHSYNKQFHSLHHYYQNQHLHHHQNPHNHCHNHQFITLFTMLLLTNASLALAKVQLWVVSLTRTQPFALS